MKSLMGIIYGLISYMIFFIAFLYAIGFSGHLLVPKDINTGEVINWLPAIGINILLLRDTELITVRNRLHGKNLIIPFSKIIIKSNITVI